MYTGERIQHFGVWIKKSEKNKLTRENYAIIDKNSSTWYSKMTFICIVLPFIIIKRQVNAKNPFSLVKPCFFHSSHYSVILSKIAVFRYILSL